ncbi:MAG: hypothetical protein ACP5O6_07635 [Candidatus Baltobacteraceae bacterium]
MSREAESALGHVKEKWLIAFVAGAFALSINFLASLLYSFLGEIVGETWVPGGSAATKHLAGTTEHHCLVLGLSVLVSFGLGWVLTTRLPKLLLRPDLKQKEVNDVDSKVLGATFFVSPPQSGIEERVYKLLKDKDVTGSLGSACDIASKLCEELIKDAETKKFNGLQMLRAMKGLKGLQRVGLIYTNADSKKMADTWKSVFTNDRGANGNSGPLREVDLIEVKNENDINASRNAVAEAIDALMRSGNIVRSEIVVDCTGGTKAMSLGALLATIQHENLRLEYIATSTKPGGQEPPVLHYDVFYSHEIASF